MGKTSTGGRESRAHDCYVLIPVDGTSLVHGVWQQRNTALAFRHEYGSGYHAVIMKIAQININSIFRISSMATIAVWTVEMYFAANTQKQPLNGTIENGKPPIMKLGICISKK